LVHFYLYLEALEVQQVLVVLEALEVQVVLVGQEAVFLV
jgi:hypothetical protein